MSSSLPLRRPGAAASSPRNDFSEVISRRCTRHTGVISGTRQRRRVDGVEATSMARLLLPTQVRTLGAFEGSPRRYRASWGTWKWGSRQRGRVIGHLLLTLRPQVLHLCGNQSVRCACPSPSADAGASRLALLEVIYIQLASRKILISHTVLNLARPQLLLEQRRASPGPGVAMRVQHSSSGDDVPAPRESFAQMSRSFCRPSSPRRLCGNQAVELLWRRNLISTQLGPRKRAP